MNVQIYCGKKNFDAQKAERWFKERRIPFQALDLKKHKLGEREIRLMISAIGMENLIDREDLLIPAIQENPWLLKVPIVRNGNRMTQGYRPEEWEKWE